MLLGLLGCGAPDPSPGPSAPDDGLVPSPWTLPTTSTGEPPVDTDALGRALDAAVAGILAYDAAPVLDAYQAIWDTSSEPACPAATIDPYGNVYWADGCTASDGTSFGGYLSQYVTVGAYDDDAGVYTDGVELSGNVALVGPAGTFDLEGYAARYSGASADGTVTLVQSVLVGGFAYDGAADGWLRDAGLAGASVEVTLFDYDVGSVGSVVVADGAVLVEVDGAPWHVVFDLAQLASEPLGVQCGQEPGGSASIRDPLGRWVGVTFHGPDLVYGTTLGDPLQCDGCGDAVLDGEPIGQVCADFDPWYAWEAAP